jgi:hypothetical protein
VRVECGGASSAPQVQFETNTSTYFQHIFVANHSLILPRSTSADERCFACGRYGESGATTAKDILSQYLTAEKQIYAVFVNAEQLELVFVECT